MNLRLSASNRWRNRRGEINALSSRRRKPFAAVIWPDDADPQPPPPRLSRPQYMDRFTAAMERATVRSADCLAGTVPRLGLSKTVGRF